MSELGVTRCTVVNSSCVGWVADYVGARYLVPNVLVAFVPERHEANDSEGKGDGDRRDDDSKQPAHPEHRGEINRPDVLG